MNVLRVVRGLVVLEWSLIAFCIASYFVELGLPESLHGATFEGPRGTISTLGVAISGAATAVHLAASAGLWRLAAWARPAYAASTLALLLSNLFLGGGGGLPALSTTLSFASIYASGALLAVLYLPSRISAPLTGAAGPARRLGGLGGVLLAVLGGFALVGLALSVALAAGVWFVLHFGEVLEEGQRAAEGRTDAECVSLALARRESRWLVPESIFLSECLAYAAASEDLCAGAPAEDDEAASAAWIAERCDGPESPPNCKHLMAALQIHCQERG